MLAMTAVIVDYMYKMYF